MPTHEHANEFRLPSVPSRQHQGLDAGLQCAMVCLGSTALRDFMMPLGATAYKTGLTARRYMDEKILEMRNRGYAAIVAPKEDRDHPTSIHPLPREWFLSRLPDPTDDAEAMALLRQLPQGTYDDGVITFRLAPELRIAPVEKRYQKVLGSRNLNRFLDSPDGKKRLREVGLPETTRLFSDYRDIGEVRRSLAMELFLVRPQKELVVLLKALILAIELELASNKQKL